MAGQLMQQVNSITFQWFMRKLGLREFLQGFYYFKCLEYPLAFNHLSIRKNENYLDVGSGKSIFPFFVSQRANCNMHIVDVESVVNDNVTYYQQAMNRFGLFNRKLFVYKIAGDWEGVIAKGLLSRFQGDDNSLVIQSGGGDLPSEYFHKISCLSVLEHIRNDGDSRMMETIGRILKRGGRAVITFPFSPVESTEEKCPADVRTEFEAAYWQRRYTIQDIKTRLIEPSRLKVAKVIYFGERYPKFGELYTGKKIRPIRCLIPFCSFLLWRVFHAYEGEFRNFPEPQILEKHGVGLACIVLKKEFN